MNYSVTQIVTSFTLTTTWSPWDIHVALSYPCWTLSTLTAFYIIFPFILPTLETFSNKMLTLLIVIMYHVQCLPYILSVYLTSFLKMTVNGTVYETLNGTLEVHQQMHPLFRLPVFTMGCATGLLLLRGEQYPSENYGVVHDIFPWRLTSSETPVNTKTKRVNRNSIFVCLFIIFSVIKTTLIQSLPKFDVYGQFFLCHAQLGVIVGLIQDQSSFVTSMCR